MNAARRSAWRTTASAFGLALVVAMPGPSGAVTCNPSQPAQAYQTYDLNWYPNTLTFTQARPYWAAVGVATWDMNSDYDIKLYGSCAGGTVIASSQSTAGYTDFVIGDFNHMPYRGLAADAYCFTGECTGPDAYGATVWENGDILLVDGSVQQVSFDPSQGAVPADAIMHVWDVNLTQGQTYWFNFHSSIGTASKMLLFRNASGGAYYTGRGGAEWEATGSVRYTAPASGFYALVEVNDQLQPGTYTISVTSSMTCSFSSDLAPETPVSFAAPPDHEYFTMDQVFGDWTAIGLRPSAGGDWDLEVDMGGIPSSCAGTVLANSAQLSGHTDLVVVNQAAADSFTALGAHAYRFSGGGYATAEASRSYGFDPSMVVYPNGAAVSGTWGTSAVLKCYSMPLQAGHQYIFSLGATSNVRYCVFLASGAGVYAAGRSSALLDAGGTATFTAPADGNYALVVLKEDDATGSYTFQAEECGNAVALQPGITAITATTTNDYFDVDVTHGRWMAVGLDAPAADWDLFLYGSGTAPWPDCWSPLRGGSETSSLQDFIVGDFHANAPGTYHFRATQYTPGAARGVYVQYSGAASFVQTNAPSVNTLLNWFDVVQVHEAYLVAGRQYLIQYNPTLNVPLLVFGNSGAGEYWAGRTNALFSTLSSTTFTPAKSGYYGLVVANDGLGAGSYDLGVYTTSTADVNDAAPERTRFEGASPNPGRSGLALRYALAAPAHVKLDLVDLAGRRVWTSDEGIRPPGRFAATLRRQGAEGHPLSAGLYFVRFEVNGRLAGTERLTLLE